MPSPILRADALSKTVQSGDDPLTILDDVSFDIEAGASVAIVGASGSGKTTLLGLLAGLDQPTSLEFIGNTAYVVTLSGEVWRIDGVSDPPFGPAR